MKRICKAAGRSVAHAGVRKASWPEGATAGVLLVAAACLAFSVTLYQVAAPGEPFAEMTAAD